MDQRIDLVFTGDPLLCIVAGGLFFVIVLLILDAAFHTKK